MKAVKLELQVRVKQTHTIIREVSAAKLSRLLKNGQDVCAWLTDEFQDDSLSDSDISTDPIEVQEWKKLEAP